MSNPFESADERLDRVMREAEEVLATIENDEDDGIADGRVGFKSLDAAESDDGEALLDRQPDRPPLTEGQAADNRLQRSLPPGAVPWAVTQQQLGDAVEETAKSLYVALTKQMPQLIREQLPDPDDHLETIALRVGRIAQFEIDRVSEGLAESFKGHVAELRQAYEKQLAEIRREHAREMQGLRSLLVELIERTPAPIVNVDAPAVTVQAPPAPVVNVPASAIRVTAEAPPARRTVTTKRIEYDAAGSGRPARIVEETDEVDA